MRQLEVYHNGRLAGYLTEDDRLHYSFRYDHLYRADSAARPVSLTLPKTAAEYTSPTLFPFFFNMLSEGANRRMQARLLRIDETDDFGLLSATAVTDTIGAITVKPVAP
jgi:HipA-like protein